MRYIFSVPDMSCDHCRKRITEALDALNEVKDINIDLDEKRVEVISDGDPEALIQAIDQAGYDAFLNEGI
ncbi:MAG: heavy-metal-associated domain-containing protein [Spirochaetia bacterium]|nr:heavy-metal-associated domain-containing protein [Spirochaetia bacterium]MCF7941733.1 heavy-metal-associated domain-containing protein [Spirochaetia bacterium]